MMCVSRTLARRVDQLLVLVLMMAVGPPARAQAPFEWPEKAKNLEDLPDSTSGDKLRAIMMGFTRALGVRCSHCHVGEEGKPLGTFDFVSDENPKKDIARDMYRMLGDINSHLAKMNLAETQRVNMWCNTCHHGRPLPRTLADELTVTYEAAGIDSTVGAYNALRERFYGRASYDFGVGSLNEVGSSLLSQGRGDDALRVLQLNVDRIRMPPAHTRASPTRIRRRGRRIARRRTTRGHSSSSLRMRE